MWYLSVKDQSIDVMFQESSVFWPFWEDWTMCFADMLQAEDDS